MKKIQNISLTTINLLILSLIYQNFIGQDLIRNGNFELKDETNPVTMENPKAPCIWGAIQNAPLNSTILNSSFENGNAYAEYWLSFGNPNLGAKHQASIFDSRVTCTVDVFATLGCDPENCTDGQWQVGVPDNAFGTQSHRLAIDGTNIIGRYIALKTQPLHTDQGVQTKMIEPLECGMTYQLKYFAVKKGDSEVIMHVRFSETGKWNDPIPYNTDGHTDFDVEITDETNWQEVVGKFQLYGVGEGDQIVVMDLLGKVVHTSICGAGTKQLDLTDESAGTYFVKVTTNHGVSTTLKIVKD